MLPSAKDPLSIHCLAPLLLGPQFGHHPFLPTSALRPPASVAGLECFLWNSLRALHAQRHPALSIPGV